MSSNYDFTDIPIVSPPEAVRMRPAMYLGSTDQRGLHQLLRYALEGVFWHYSYLKQPLDGITVRLEADGSVTLESRAEDRRAAFLERNVELLKNALAIWGSRTYYGLIFANALCAHVSLGARGLDDQWCLLTFEQGILRGEEVSLNPPNESWDMWLRLWPDFTLLEPGTFDSQEVMALVHSISCPPYFVREPGQNWAEATRFPPVNNLVVPITVTDARSPAAS